MNEAHTHLIAQTIDHINTLADMRKHLADDEHMDPLPIHGSRACSISGAYDRPTRSAQQVAIREMYNVATATVNEEEGA